MKATPHRFSRDAYSVTDEQGRMYTVQATGISRHQYRHGRVTLVPVERPELAARIMAAVDAIAATA